MHGTTVKINITYVSPKIIVVSFVVPLLKQYYSINLMKRDKKWLV